jgi:hypothetical protein
MRILLLSLFIAAATSLAADQPVPPAYSAEIVSSRAGLTMRMHVWSDGTIVRSQSADGKSGNYTDYDRKLMWMYGTGFSCLQLPIEPEGHKTTKREEVVGNETIDGHPTKKVKVTASVNDGKKTTTSTYFEWRATDLHDLAIRRRAEDGSFEWHLEHIVAGKPDAKLLAFPSPQCHYDETLDNTHNAPQAGGGFRSIRFFDASCKQLVALPLTMSIPSDYAIRAAGHSNCFWGANEDLDRVILPQGPDFGTIHRGVFWCRAAGSTEFDPVHDKFVSEQGVQDQWAAAMKAMGWKNVVVSSAKIGEIPSVRVTGSLHGQRVYMLYLAVPHADSPAILINYHAAAKGTAGDDAVWRHFLESIQVAAK